MDRPAGVARCPQPINNLDCHRIDIHEPQRIGDRSANETRVRDKRGKQAGMGSGHSHSHARSFKNPEGLVRIVLLVLGPMIALTVIGMIALWPSSEDLPVIAVGDFVQGTVQQVVPCDNGDPKCAVATVSVDEGPDTGDTIEINLTIGSTSPTLEPGTAVLLQPLPDSAGGQAYALADVDRSTPLLVLCVLFAAAVVLLAGWKGVSALVGLLASLGILAVFVLPALLQGGAPVPVAAVGAAAIAIVSMGLAHGFNVRTGVALIGTLVALFITTALGWIFTEALNFTGAATEDAAYLQAVAGGTLDLRGLLLAGLVIGALGVLDDVTVTQAAAVWEVYGADDDVSLKSLWTAGMRVGRDHVAAVVNTLVLAYVGASLPLFLLITLSDAPLVQSLNNEVIASEIVRSLVGGLGIIAAVPLTTMLAAALLVDTRRRSLAASRFVSR